MNILKNIKSCARKYLESHEYIKVLSNKEELLEIIQKLQPVETGHELIRIGCLNDGGYLIPNDLDGISVCISPGTAGEFSFERHLADKYGRFEFLETWDGLMPRGAVFKKTGVSG
jgi:hypothetical protein